MSILRKLNRKTFENLPDILLSYEEKIKDWKSHVIIDGKNIEKANIEQSSWLAYYDQIRVELRTLVDFFDMKVKEIRGEVTSYIIQKSEIDHNERTRERMIDASPEYIKIFQYFLQVKEIYNMVDSIVNQFRDRAFVLNNLVKIRIANIQDINLFLDE